MRAMLLVKHNTRQTGCKIVNPTHQNPQYHAVIHKQEVMWLKQTGASATAALLVDRQKMFPLSETTTDLFSSFLLWLFAVLRLALSAVDCCQFGSLSSMSHCKSEGKRFKKSTSSEVISIMKFELPFINEKKPPQIHLLIFLLLEKISESLVFYDQCGISVMILCLWFLPAEVCTFPCSLPNITSLKNVVTIRSGLAVKKAALCSTTVVQNGFQQAFGTGQNIWSRCHWLTEPWSHYPLLQREGPVRLIWEGQSHRVHKKT